MAVDTLGAEGLGGDWLIGWFSAFFARRLLVERRRRFCPSGVPRQDQGGRIFISPEGRSFRIAKTSECRQNPKDCNVNANWDEWENDAIQSLDRGLVTLVSDPVLSESGALAQSSERKAGMRCDPGPEFTSQIAFMLSAIVAVSSAI